MLDLVIMIYVCNPCYQLEILSPHFLYCAARVYVYAKTRPLSVRRVYEARTAIYEGIEKKERKRAADA